MYTVAWQAVAQFATLENMRATLNISMPVMLKKRVDRLVKEYDYASTSEFFREAIRTFEDDKLIKDIMESEREFAAGKGKLLRSLKDLM